MLGRLKQFSAHLVKVEKSFKARLIHGQLSPELIFAKSVLKRMRLSSLANEVVYRETFNIYKNDSLTSRHGCRFCLRWI